MTRQPRPSLPPSLAVLAVCDFLLLSGCFTVSAWWTQSSTFELYLFYQGGLQQVFVAAVSIQAMLYLERMYEGFGSWFGVFRQMCLALGAAFLLQAVFAFIHASVEMPRWIMIRGAGIAVVSFPLWRLAAAAMLGKVVPARKVVFLGGTQEAAELASRFEEQPELGLEAIGYFGPKTDMDLARLGSIPQLSGQLNEYTCDRIVISRKAKGLPIRRLLELQRGGTRLEKLGDVYEAVSGRVSLHELPSEVEPRPAYVIARDIYSVLIAAILLVPAAAIMTAIAIMGRGPLFERELRVGLNGRPIRMYRFRRANLTPWLSALPLLVNVFRGELALVGPAPEQPEFAAVLAERIPLYRLRLCVKPGITGWAQVHRDSGPPDALAALERDLYYIKHLSPALDAYIAVLALRPR